MHCFVRYRVPHPSTYVCMACSAQPSTSGTELNSSSSNTNLWNLFQQFFKKVRLHRKCLSACTQVHIRSTSRCFTFASTDPDIKLLTQGKTPDRDLIKGEYDGYKKNAAQYEHRAAFEDFCNENRSAKRQRPADVDLTQELPNQSGPASSPVLVDAFDHEAAPTGKHMAASVKAAVGGVCAYNAAGGVAVLRMTDSEGNVMSVGPEKLRHFAWDEPIQELMFFASTAGTGTKLPDGSVVRAPLDLATVVQGHKGCVHMLSSSPSRRKCVTVPACSWRCWLALRGGVQSRLLFAVVLVHLQRLCVNFLANC